MWFSSLVEISKKIMQAHRLGIIFLLIEANFGGIASFATMDEIVDGIDLVTPPPPRRGPGFIGNPLPPQGVGNSSF